MIYKNEAVEVSYAGQSIRGWAIEVNEKTVKVQTEFGCREFERNMVRGLRFIKS